MKVSADARCPITTFKSREAATKVLRRTWKKIAEFERKYYESGQERIDLAVQIELMKKQCMEIMQNVKKAEKLLESN